MEFFTFLILNGLAGTSSYLIAFRILRLSRSLDQAASWFLVYIAEIMLSVLALGIDGILTLQKLALFHALVLILLIIHTRKLKSLPFNTANIAHALQELNASRFARLGLSTIIAFSCIKIFINLTNAPLGWDCLNYHFVFPVEGIHHGNLQTPIIINDDPAPTYYPLNGSFWYFWLMIPFQSAFFANIGQIPFFIMTFFMIFAIARAYGLNRAYSLLPAILFILIPNVFKHYKLAYVDMMVAAYFVTSAYFLLRLSERYKRGEVIAFALSTGLLIGTKTIALPYSILLIIPFALVSLMHVKKGGLKLCVAACMIIFLLSAFSYIRNWIQTGNPLYPLQISFFNKVFWKGVLDSVTYRAHFTPKDYALSKLLFHEGLGAQTILFILPAALCAFPVWFMKRTVKRDWMKGYLLALPILIFAVYRFIVPLANTRYLYPCLALGIVAAMVTLRMLTIPQRIVTIIATLCIFACIPELDKNIALVFGILLTAILFFIFSRKKNIGTIAIYSQKPSTWLAIGIVISAVIIVLNNAYSKLEFKRYGQSSRLSGFWPEAIEGWDWLNQHTTGNTIAYVGRPVPYPLYGTRFKNDVRYVSVNAQEPAKLHLYPKSWYSWGFDFESQHVNMMRENNYRGNADYTTWLENLRKAKADFLFIYSLHQTLHIIFPIEEEWASAHPDVFKPEFSNDVVRIYSIRKP